MADQVYSQEDSDFLDAILSGVFGTAENPAPGSFLESVLEHPLADTLRSDDDALD